MAFERLQRAGANFALALANGYILFLFSERLFWGVWRPGDQLADQLVTWLAYSTAAYLFLAVVHWFRVRTWAATALAGAIYGWLIEGTLAPTLYGTEASAPFPLSLCITAVSWHMLISVSIGWFAFGRALEAGRWRRVAGLAAGLGVFWAVWATFQWRETPPVIATPVEFLAHALTLTLGLALAWWVNLRLGRCSLRPGPVGVGLSGLVLGLFYVQHVKHLGVRPLVILPAVLAFGVVPLWRRRLSPPLPLGTVAAPRAMAKALCGLGLLFLPLLATGMYGLAGPLHLERVPVSSIVFYWITAPAGCAVFIGAWIQCWLGARPGAVA